MAAPGKRSNDMPGIVVGVDGSGGSQQALEWAVKHAAQDHVPLTVLAVHEVAESWWTGASVNYPQDRSDEEKARQAVQEELNKILGGVGDDKPESVTVRVVSGQAASVLIDASGNADLVVVGSRGAGGFPHLRLGSVTTKVVSHAECPVVVVRHT
jgi:nucleotide-binding universal stress UspA family protein